MSITLERPAVAAAATQANQTGHLPWCTEHWDDDPERPGPCFATDVTIPFRGDEVEVAMSAVAGDGKDPSLTLFLASKDILDGPSFPNLAEAETAAWAMLAMVARARGELAESARYALRAHRAAKD